MQETRTTDDLNVLLHVLPDPIRNALEQHNRFDELIEVVMDLGRAPESRYVGADGGSEEVLLQNLDVQQADLDFVLERIGNFDADNRAGITRTLHRISGIKNRRGKVVGLTLRIGRAVYGTIEIIEDLISSGKSVLLLGRPGVGKTTMLREAARVLATTKRVVIVDTSNEIGGDGDISHPAVGRARRMQVAKPSLQHEVMIEAVENHNPQVIVIDEIGRAAEADAARTIAERGVQLIGTAHGQTLDNLMQNPTLSDLVGGIESVTLSDDEARRRRTQKTVLERRAPPTFQVLIEIQDRHKLLVHPNLAEAVDGILRNKQTIAELRWVDGDGRVHREQVSAKSDAPSTGGGGFGPNDRPVSAMQSHSNGLTGQPARQTTANSIQERAERRRMIDAGRPLSELFGVPGSSSHGVNLGSSEGSPAEQAADAPPGNFRIVDPKLRLLQIYPFGIARNRLMQAVRELGVPAAVVESVDDADVVITAKSYYRQRPRAIVDAEHRSIPIYVLRSNSALQMENIVAGLFNLGQSESNPVDDATNETQDAIRRILSGEKFIDLSPQNQFVRRKQHELSREANLVSHSHGKEPYRHVRLYRE